MRRGVQRGGHIASGVEQQGVLLDAALVGHHGVGGVRERDRGVIRQRVLDLGETGRRAV